MFARKLVSLTKLWNRRSEDAAKPNKRPTGMLLPAYIASGGQSRRFGTDKARALLSGTPLILRVAEKLAPRTSAITVIADAAGKYADLHLRTIADRIPGKGPLSALDAALHDAPNNTWLLLVSCDLLDLQPHWLDELLAARDPAVQAVAFRNQYWEPLLALYHTSLRQQVEQRLTTGPLSMQDLLNSVPTRALPLPADWPAVSQANTPAELQHAQNQMKEKTMPEDKDPKKLPGTYKAFITKFPAMGKAHEDIAKAADSAGPLDRKTCELIKIGLSVGGGLESATRSHIRRAMEHGATEAEIEQAILLAMNTCGFPRTVMAWQWAQIQFERERQDQNKTMA